MSAHFKLRLQKEACGPAQFETRYDAMLRGRVSEDQFDATIQECNRILRVHSGHGLGCLNIGWVCFPFLCCFCVQEYRTRRALKEVKIFLRTESQRIYLGLGIHLQLQKKDVSYVDVNGRYHSEVRRHIRIDVAVCPPASVLHFPSSTSSTPLTSPPSPLHHLSTSSLLSPSSSNSSLSSNLPTTPYSHLSSPPSLCHDSTNYLFTDSGATLSTKPPTASSSLASNTTLSNPNYSSAVSSASSAAVSPSSSAAAAAAAASAASSTSHPYHYQESSADHMASYHVAGQGYPPSTLPSNLPRSAVSPSACLTFSAAELSAPESSMPLPITSTFASTLASPERHLHAPSADPGETVYYSQPQDSFEPSSGPTSDADRSLFTMPLPFSSPDRKSVV